MKTERNIGEEILEGIREIKAHKAGTKTLRTYTLQEPSAPQAIRAKLQLSQAAFAGLMGVGVHPTSLEDRRGFAAGTRRGNAHNQVCSQR